MNDELVETRIDYRTRTGMNRGQAQSMFSISEEKRKLNSFNPLFYRRGLGRARDTLNDFVCYRKIATGKNKLKYFQRNTLQNFTRIGLKIYTVL